MAGPFDNLLGVHATALTVHRARMDQIASNIANADTPNYLARDLDFGTLLNAAARNSSATRVAMSRTAPAHIAPATDSSEGARVYRIPMQPAQDGNTVELATENAKFAEAAMRYQATLTFIERRMRTLNTAITGGE